MFRLANYSLIFCSLFEKHSKRMKGFGGKLLNRPRHVSLAHVGRCSGCNSVVSARDWRSSGHRFESRSFTPHCLGYRIACVFRRHNKPSVPSIMVSMMGDVNIGVDAAKAACWSTRDREARRLELTPGSGSVGTVSNKSLDFYALLCAHCNCSPVPVTSVIQLFIYVHNLLFVFVCKKVAKLISIWLKKSWTFSHIG